MNETSRIVTLRQQLHEHNHRYYVENNPIISDQEFDLMMHELQELEALHPELYDPNSPTMRVGSDITKEFRQVRHKYPMLSLANTYNEQDVTEWYNQVSRGLEGEPFEVCCEMKYDGLSISLTYEHGQLVQAVTRGDGVQLMCAPYAPYLLCCNRDWDGRKSLRYVERYLCLGSRSIV